MGKGLQRGCGWVLWGLVLGCAPTSEAARGQLIVSIDTDMAIPKDLSAIRVQVDVYRGNEWQPKFDREFEVAPSKGAVTFLPATLAVVAGETAEETVRVEVQGLSEQGEERVLRRAITTVPADRIALLRMPLSWSCLDELACDETQTCQLGRCTDATVGVEDLPSYEPEEVFGGAEAPGGTDGRCFAVESCFSESFEVEPSYADADYCQLTLDTEPSAALNFAVRGDPDSTGICGGFDGSEHCYLPLNQSASLGWSELETPKAHDGLMRHRLQLPPGICDRLQADTKLSLRASTSCASKTDSLGSCGPWSSASKPLDPPGAGGSSSGGSSSGGSSSGGSSSGGSTATGGAGESSAGSGAGSSPIGGSPQVAGASGTGTSGKGGESGSGGSGGSGGSPAGYPCTESIAPALLTRFTSLEPDPKNPGQFLVDLPAPGGATFAYPAGAGAPTIGPAGSFHVSGTVSTYSGFGVYLNECLDASAFSAISFSMRGNAGPSGKIQFRMVPNQNRPVDHANQVGVCIVPAGGSAYEYCRSGSTSLPVIFDGGVVTVRFADITGGLPVAFVNGRSVVSFEWALEWASGDEPYSFDIIIDNLTFTSAVP
ncbi:MAG: hypothetical protein EOO73_13815 [Myxococcales bacterium]|nr:MAG: hypothetical protein EOO73_13815 [Myxococcales bacterium]